MKIDNVVPGEKWQFDSSVADCFEDMLNRSIPNYLVMRNSCTTIAYDVIKTQNKLDNFSILDLGCSDGLMIQNFLKVFDNKGNYIGVDNSKPMILNAKDRFAKNDNVTVDVMDLRTDFPAGTFDIITSVLTLQFTPIECRQQILKNIYEALNNNGCFIFVEKILGDTSKINNMMVRNYYRMKSANGYSEEQIEKKRLSLEGVLVPVTNDWNIDFLRKAGFTEVDCFWRWMNFAGYVAFK